MTKPLNKISELICDRASRMELKEIMDKHDIEKQEHDRIKDNKAICEEAPFPNCNGAIGCDTCEYREVEDDIE